MPLTKENVLNFKKINFRGFEYKACTETPEVGDTVVDLIDGSVGVVDSIISNTAAVKDESCSFLLPIIELGIPLTRLVKIQMVISKV